MTIRELVYKYRTQRLARMKQLKAPQSIVDAEQERVNAVPKLFPGWGTIPDDPIEEYPSNSKSHPEPYFLKAWHFEATGVDARGNTVKEPYLAEFMVFKVKGQTQEIVLLGLERLRFMGDFSFEADVNPMLQPH